jgi:Reverse transcriptase (RNA-dependent DNA polymerase)
LFIYDVIAVLTKNECACQLYADDLKLYTAIFVDCDKNELQERLNDLQVWFNSWQLKISYEKCVTMLINTAGHKPNVDLKLGNDVIPPANDVKDMGILIDYKLAFTLLIIHVNAKAFARANLISEYFISQGISTLMHAFNVCVRHC